MSAQPPVSQKRVTAPEITARKGREPIVSLTSYHAHTAAIADPFVDFLLVGDSLGEGRHQTGAHRLDDRNGSGKPAELCALRCQEAVEQLRIGARNRQLVLAFASARW